MFGKAKIQENHFVIAVKDFANTSKALEEGKLRLPFDKSVYKELIATVSNKVDNLKELSRFIKTENKSKGEVKHYWEGLINEGYTLMDVFYEKRTPSLERLCNAENFKLVCGV